MRDMIGATHPQMIDILEHHLQIRTRHAECNRRFAFSGITMPFTYAIAATPPPPDSTVAAAISPLKEAVSNLQITTNVREAMAALEAAMDAAQSGLNQLLCDPEPASAEELVDELKRTVRVSMLTALLGSTGVVDLARSEFDARQQELKHPPPQSRWVELAAEPVRPVSSPTDTTVSIEDVYQSAAPGVQGALQAMRRGLLHGQVTTEMACPQGQAGRMSLCPGPIPASSVMTSCGSPVTATTG
jgi:hypothetical protein